MIRGFQRARRALHGIDEQVAKAVAGLAPVKRNRFIALDGAVGTGPNCHRPPAAGSRQPKPRQ